MNNLQEIKESIDHLTPEELRELRLYINQREAQTQPAHLRSPEDRIRLMDEAAKAIREAFTDEQWAEVEQSMNEEYIEPWDESEWTD